MNFNDFLQEKTKEYSAVVKDFTEVLALYEGEAEEQINDACMEAYYKAVDAVRLWIRLVEQVDLLESNYMESIAVLHLPTDDIRISVSARAILASDVDVDGAKAIVPEIEGYDLGYEELLGTPIGEMGFHTLQKILEIEDNPVKILYLHFQDLLHCIHNMLSMPLHDELPPDTILTEELLAEHGIQDVLEVHKMDKILFNVEDFFKNFMR